MALPTSITLSIVTPDHSYTHEVDYVSLPGAEGDFGVLPGHTPFFTALRTGQMWYQARAPRSTTWWWRSGFVEVLPDRVYGAGPGRRAAPKISTRPAPRPA